MKGIKFDIKDGAICLNQGQDYSHARPTIQYFPTINYFQVFSCIFEKTPENVFISKNIFKCLVAFLKKFQKLSSRVCIPENDIENIFSITFPYFSHLPSTYIVNK